MSQIIRPSSGSQPQIPERPSIPRRPKNFDSKADAPSYVQQHNENSQIETYQAPSAIYEEIKDDIVSTLILL